MLDPHSGGYRIQRIPPTEKRNRTHTSTVTVAIIDPEEFTQSLTINDSDFRVEWFSGTGAGGQFRNKHMNSCRVIHIPSGLTEARQSRSRASNLQEAKTALINRLQNYKESQLQSEFGLVKKDLLGSGQRGDKILTIQFQNDKVTHHKTHKNCRIKEFMNGKMNLLW